MNNNYNKLIVTPSPHVTTTHSTNMLMLMMIVALIPTTVMGVINSGINALWMILISVASCYLLDIAFVYMKEKIFAWTDLSGVVTGLVLALILPVNAPLYFPVIGAVLAIVIFKGCFGGIGKNIFNPAAAARMILGFMFAGLSLELFTGSAIGENVMSPLAYYVMGDYSSITIRSLFFGSVTGAIGTVSIMCVLIGGILLMCFKVTDYVIPVGALVTFIATCWVGDGAVSIIPYLFSGSFMFVTMFMLPEPTSSPNTVWGKLVYGLLFGLLAGLFRVYDVLGETSVFVALICVNLLANLLDKIFAPHPLGVRRG